MKALGWKYEKEYAADRRRDSDQPTSRTNRYCDCGAACKMQRAPGLQLSWAAICFEVGFPVTMFRFLGFFFFAYFHFVFELTLLLVRNPSPIHTSVLLLLVYSLLWSGIDFFSGGSDYVCVCRLVLTIKWTQPRAILEES